MVTKKLKSGAGGNLGNPADNFGKGSDIIKVVDGSNFFENASIATYGGKDTIDLTAPAATGEHDVYAGSGNDIIKGGLGFDLVVDGSGDDTITLGAKDDVWDDCAGNDTADGGAGSDLISFLYKSTDTIGLTVNTKGVSLDLAKSAAQNLGIFGIDKIKGFEQAEGSEGNDIFLGNAATNYLYGDGGNDVLNGRGGNDFLRGSDGKDVIIGGAGKDTIDLLDKNFISGLTVSASDKVRYFKASESGPAAAKRDIITGFESGGAAGDKIDLSHVDGNSALSGHQSFTFTTTAFTAPGGEIRLQTQGADTIIHVDTDADSADEMSILVQGTVGLTAADFII